MDILNAIVQNKTYGEGTIVSAEGNYITVAFPAGNKKFAYPDSFEKFLKFQDQSLQDQVENLLKVKKEKLLKKTMPKQTQSTVREDLKYSVDAVKKSGKMKYTREKLISAIDNGFKFSFHPFYGHKQTEVITDACFSNWYECNFEVNGVIYHTSEQYMMSQKALLFNDMEIYKEIMTEDNPKAYKALGRKVKNFNSYVWNQNNYRIVLEGCMAKFSQNPDFARVLLETGDQVIVEAAPRDTIWGVGLGKNNEKINDPTLWRGSNYLGFALMEVRDELKRL